MATITASQINQKIKSLPINLLYEVDKYIEFLAFKSSHSDWAEELSEQQFSLIEKGKKRHRRKQSNVSQRSQRKN